MMWWTIIFTALFVKSSCQQDVQLNCSEIEISQPQFMKGEVFKLHNITWGSNEFGDFLPCVEKFVLLYDWDDGANSGVLCPTFNVTKLNDSLYGCTANFSELTCNKSVHITLEAWLDNSVLLQNGPEGQVFVNCSEAVVANSSDGALFHSNQNLSEAVLSILDSVSPLISSPDQGCTWTQWSEWSSCSVTCGQAGVQTRSRSQLGSQLCQKRESEDKKCHRNKCPQDCSWAMWSEWSTCSQTCGTGRRTRARDVEIRADFGGRNCDMKEGQEVESCLGLPCPVDGLWSEWSKWSYCNVTCGQGFKRRTRLCDNPKPENGGSECEGASLEVEPCQALRECPPINGGWSLWTKWSSCSQSCGEGKVIRTRTCTDPSPQNGGFGCHGDSVQQKPCYLRKCDHSGPYVVQNTSNYKCNCSGCDEEVTLKSKENQGCLDAAPHIFGFLGPFLSFEEDTLNYTCYHGKVIDELTNRKSFQLPCGFKDDFSSPKQWPHCKEPKYCIGPAPQLFESMLLSFPKRDVPVMTALTYSSPIKASCFLDGIYRSQNSRNVHSSCNNTSISIEEPHQFGWVELQGNGNETQPCSLDFFISHKVILKIGIEEMTYVQLEGLQEEQAIILHQNSTFHVKMDHESSLLRFHYLSFTA